jgi:hypothetical protein
MSGIYKIADILLSFIILIILSTVFVISKELANGIVSGKYFWLYISMALLSMVAIPAAIIKRKERMSFKLPDLLILLFCLATILITLHHTGRLTNKCLLLIFLTLQQTKTAIRKKSGMQDRENIKNFILRKEK